VVVLVAAPAVVIERAKLSREVVGSMAVLARLAGVTLGEGALGFFAALNHEACISLPPYFSSARGAHSSPQTPMTKAPFEFYISFSNLFS